MKLVGSTALFFYTKIALTIGITLVVILFIYLTFFAGPKNFVADTISPLADNSIFRNSPSNEVLGIDTTVSTQSAVLPSATVPNENKLVIANEQAVLGGSVSKTYSLSNKTVGQPPAKPEPAEPSPTPKAATPVVIPEYMNVFDSGDDFDWHKGKIKFHFKADWHEGESMDLLYFNFNGADRKNLFYVGMVDNVFTFDSYTDDLTSDFDETNGDIGSDFPGKEYDIELTWDFTVSAPYKRIYINGRLESEQQVVLLPNGANPKAYVGPVTNLVITKE